MADLTLRLAKGTPLTNLEVDTNFSNLNTAKLELGQSQATGNANSVVFFNSSQQITSSANLVFTGSRLGIGTNVPSSSLHVIGNAFLSGNVSATASYLLGPELVTNGDFSAGTTGWIADSGCTLSASGGLLTVTTTADAAFAIQQNSVYQTGKAYQVTFTYRVNNTTTARLRSGATVLWSETGSLTTKTVTAVVSPTTTTFEFGVTGGTVTEFYISNISVREVIISADSSNILIGKSLETPRGSAAAPTYTFLNDTNTGIFSPAADTLAFAEGGSEVMRIDSSGNVGIGISAPTSTLHVNGVANITGNASVLGNLQIGDNRFVYLGTPSVSLSRRSFLQLRNDGSYSDFSLRWGSTSYGPQTGPELDFVDSSGALRYFTNRTNQKATLVLGNYTNNAIQSLQIKGGITNYSSPNAVATQELDAQQGIVAVRNSIAVASNSIGLVSILPVYNQSTGANIFNTDLLINRTETSLGTTPGEQLFFDAEVGNVTKIKINTAGTITSNLSANSSVLVSSGYSLLGNNTAPVIDLLGTWNTSGTPTGIKLNITDTASNAASLLMDLQTGGTSRFKVDKAGGATFAFNVTAQNFIAAPNTTASVRARGDSGLFTLGVSDDVIITRDAADTLAQRRTTNAQTFRVYNTFTDASNYERISIGWTANVATIATENAGTGSPRSLNLTGSNGFINVASNVVGASTGNFNLGSSGTRWRSLFLGSTLTSSVPAIDIEQTWNSAGTQFTTISANVTDTASTANSLLMNLQVGGSSRFLVAKTGRLDMQGDLRNYATGGGIRQLSDTGYFAIGVLDDVVLTRDAANTLAQRNAANPQTFRLYNTFTNASNYERAEYFWSGNVAGIALNSAGTGTARSAFRIVAGPTIEMQVSASTNNNVTVNFRHSSSLAAPGTSVSHVGRISGHTGFFDANGVVTLAIPSGANDRWAFFGTTSAFPALKRVGANLHVRLADDSAFTSIIADTISGNIGAAYLPDSGVTAGSYGSITEIPTFTVDAKGRITLAANSGTNLDNRYLRLAGAAFQQVQGNVQFEGNVSFLGNVVTVSANNLIIQDNFIYLNDGDTLNNIDFGFVGNYNDGIYRHAGFFRDATDGYWKVFDNYLPEPDAAVDINTGNASYREANFKANVGQFSSLTLANIDGKSITTTGRVGVGTTNPLAMLEVTDTNLAGSGSLANSVVNITQTWNTTGTPTAVKVNVTDTASNVNSLLFDLQTGGSSKFRVDKGGTTYLPMISGDWSSGQPSLQFVPPSGIPLGLEIASGGSALLVKAGTAAQTVIRSGRIDFSSVGKLQWTNSTTNPLTTIDLILARDAPNTLALINSTNAQTFRLYNTFTDTSNYERANVGWSGNAFILGAEAAGTGSTRPINILTRSSALGGVRFVNANPGRSGYLEVRANPTSNVYYSIANDTQTDIIWNGNQINFGDALGINMRHRQDTGRACWGLNVNYPISNASYQFRSVATSDSVMVIQGIASQTGDLQRWVDTSGNVLAAVTSSGSLQLANIVSHSAETANLATTSQTQIASFAASQFSSGKFIVQAKDTNTGQVHISEILIAHNNVTAVATEYGVVYTGSNVLATFDVDISSGNVRLLASSASTNNTLYKVSETLITS